MARVIILGHKGMLGHMVKLYLEQFYNIETIDYRWPAEEFKQAIKNSDADFLVNCVGAIPQRTKEFSINHELPIWLDQNFSGKIIHPGTDCEIDNDAYGTSKRIGTDWVLNQGSRTKVIKTSIIGPELNSNASLMYWFLSNQDGSEVNGFVNHFWNGSTTLQWAKHAKVMIEYWPDQSKLTVIGSECISKWNILSIINKVYSRSIQINQFDSGKKVDKCMKCDVRYADLEQQLKELKEFYETRATK